MTVQAAENKQPALTARGNGDGTGTRQRESETPLGVMVDLETLGVSADAAILSIGAVVFTDQPDFDYDPCYQFHAQPGVTYGSAGRSVDPETLRWWMDQDADAPLEPLDRLDTALLELRDFIQSMTGGGKNVRIWSRGLMDIVMLEHAYNQIGEPVPWKYWQVRDARTLDEVAKAAGIDYPERKDELHDALGDAMHQARCVRAVLAFTQA